MNQLTLVLPFALTPPLLANDLARALQAPALETLLSRNSQHSMAEDDGEHRLLPHELWLARAFGADRTGKEAEAAPFAPALMRALGVPQQEGYWFIVQPVHLQLARTHMVLSDPRDLQLNDTDARALFDLVQPLFAEMGKQLLYATPETWFLRADDWRGLRTASPDAAAGENLSDWMPEGEAKRAFRLLQNEVQMAWHEHAVNDAREVRRLLPVNSFWLWGGADAATPALAGKLAVSAAPEWLAALAYPSRDPASLETLLAQNADSTAVLGELIQSGKAGDWSPWLAHMQQIEQHWFAPLLAALKSGRLASLRLVLTDRTRSADITVTKGSLRKFWRKPSLTKLSS
jgi:hypothetical protein